MKHFQILRAFPQPTGKWQVSVGGGIQPRWSTDGRELYFLAPDGKLMAVTVTTSGSSFSPATPVALFPASAVVGIGLNRQEYVVARDGRFRIDQPVESVPSPITVILNWHPPK